MAATLNPLESVELTDSAAPNTETADEEEEEERAWGDWRVRIGAVFLGRPDPPTRRLNDRFAYRDRYINAADLDFPIGSASDISLRLPGSVVDLDFRYFGVSQATADTGPLPGVDQFLYQSYGPFLTLHKTYSRTDYEDRASLMSSLQSAELNLRREVYPSVALLAGFRYAQFREQWAMRQDIIYASVREIQYTDDTMARNELFGFQIGSEALLYTIRRLKLEGALKAGIFGNAASSSKRRSERSIFYYGIGLREYDARRGAVAFVGDINLSAGVQLTRSIALRGGYQLLWLAGVATATDQLAAPRSVTDTNGSMFFHGATVGLECGW